MFHRTNPTKIKVDKLPNLKHVAVGVFMAALITPPLTLGIVCAFNEQARDFWFEQLGITQTEKPAQSAPTLNQ